MRQYRESQARHHRLLAAALGWLVAGAVLLLSTLVPARTELAGWTPAFWLLGAPLALLLALEPGLPRAVLALALRRGRRRRAPMQAAWH
jgi:hypothetical protein